MICIAVCDDDKRTTSALHKYLTERSDMLKNETLDIFIFESAEDFLEEVERGSIFHIIFMDIQLGGLSGVEAGKILRNRPDGHDPIIIYISNHSHFSHDLLELAVFGFLSKPLQTREIDEVFKNALAQAMKYKSITTPALLKFKVGAENRAVRVDKIAYLKNSLRVIELYTWEQENDRIKTITLLCKFYSTFDKLWTTLPSERFVQCGRSYVVNLGFVHRIESGNFILIDKASTEIPIGKKHSTAARERFFEYQEGRVWS